MTPELEAAIVAASRATIQFHGLMAIHSDHKANTKEAADFLRKSLGEVNPFGRA